MFFHLGLIYLFIFVWGHPLCSKGQSLRYLTGQDNPCCWVCQLVSCWPAAVLPTPVLQPPPCCDSSLPGCPSPPFLLVWVSVSSLSPWLLDFHTVRFFCHFWLLFVFKLLLSSFWLFEEARCVCLCLYLGQKSLSCIFVCLCADIQEMD